MITFTQVFRPGRHLAALAASVVLAGGLAMPVSAQTIGIGTTQGGATAQLGTALAQVITLKSDLQAIPQVSANTSQYIPLVNAGQLEFGVANYPQTYYAIKGTGMSTEASPNLELVASLIPFKAGMVAAEDSGIAGFADLKGRTVPRFPDNSLGDFIVRAALAAGDLSYDDVSSVPMANFPQMFQAFKDKQIDTSIATVGSQSVIDLEAAVGDVQFIPFPAESSDKITEFLPGAYLYDVPASEPLAGLDAPTTVFAYDYLLFVNKDVPDEIVGKVAKAIYEGGDFLKGTGPLWSEFDPKTIGKTGVVPMHPGAAAFYKSVGIQ